MHIIRFSFCFLFSTILVSNSSAQFNTIVKKYKIKDIEEKRIELFNSVECNANPDKQIIKTDTICSTMFFSPPLDALTVTSDYGYRKDPFTGKTKFHNGVDYRCCGDNVYSMMPGKINKIGYDKYLGNFISINHGDFSITYGHLFTVSGKKGDVLNAGQSIGISGNTGRSTGEHLHISASYKGKSINPLIIISYITEYLEKVKTKLVNKKKD